MRGAVAALTCFPPDLEINPHPQGLYDKVSGLAAVFFNSLIKDMKLNVTLVGAKVMGSCSYKQMPGNDSCEGVAGLLAAGKADFSLMTVTSLIVGPGSTGVPFLFGPQLYDAEMTFTSMPYEESHNQHITVLHPFTEIPVILIIELIVISALVLFINRPFIKRRRFVRLNIMDSIGLVLMNPAVDVHLLHQRTGYACCLFLACLTNQLFMGSMSASMVVVLPAKYYESLDDVAASNSTPTLLEGCPLDQRFQESADTARHNILKRAIARGKRYAPNDNSVFMKIAQDLTQTVSFFNAKLESTTVIGMHCFIREFSPPVALHESQPFERHAAFMAYSRSIRPDLRRHLTKFFQTSVETGIYDRRQTDFRTVLSSLGNMERLIWCMARVGKEGKKDSEVLPWNPRYYTDFVIVVAALLCVAQTAAYFETVRSASVEKQSISLQELRKKRCARVAPAIVLVIDDM